MTEHSPVQTPVTRIAFTSNVSETSQFSFETYVPQDAPIEQFHSVVDKLVRTAERQQAKSKLASLKFELEGVDKQIGLLNNDLAERQAAYDETVNAARDRHVKGGRRGDFAPQPAEKSVIDARKADLKNTTTTLDGLVWRREKLVEQIEEYKQASA
jgi:hypothetical protein